MCHFSCLATGCLKGNGVHEFTGLRMQFLKSGALPFFFSHPETALKNIRVCTPGAVELILLGIFRAVLPQRLEIAYIPFKRYLEWHACLCSFFFFIFFFQPSISFDASLPPFLPYLLAFVVTGHSSKHNTLLYYGHLLAASQVQSPCCSGTAVCVQKWHLFGFFILKITCRHQDAHKMQWNWWL